MNHESLMEVIEGRMSVRRYKKVFKTVFKTDGLSFKKREMLWYSFLLVRFNVGFLTVRQFKFH